MVKKEKEIQVEDKEIQEGKIFAILGYIGVLCLVPLLLKKDNKFALFHGKQGLILFIFEIAAGIVSIIPVLGWMVGILSLIVFPVLSLIGIVRSLMGEYWKMPVLGELAEKIII